MMGSMENRIPPPILMIATGVLMATVRFGSQPPFLPSGWRWGLVVALLLAAGLFGAPAFSAFAKASTTINPVQIDRASTLVTTGIYRITRNPMYVALTFILCAWAAWLNQPLALVGPILFAFYITRFQVIPEERTLAQKFGHSYDDYRRSVRRWL